MRLLKGLKRHLPTYQEVQQYRYLHIFGDTLKHPDLWSFNRQSVAKGVAIGLFCAFLPMPFEMVAATFMAAMLRGNLPLAFAGVWISNPFTWVPLYTPCYLLGAKILNVEPVAITDITIFELGWHYVALWMGCLIIGISLSLIAHFSISFMWRSQVRQKWRNRKLERMKRVKQNDPKESL